MTSPMTGTNGRQEDHDYCIESCRRPVFDALSAAISPLPMFEASQYVLQFALE